MAVTPNAIAAFAVGSNAVNPPGGTFTVTPTNNGGSLPPAGSLWMASVGWRSSTQALPDAVPSGWTLLGAKYDPTFGGLAVYAKVLETDGVPAAFSLTIANCTVASWTSNGSWRKTNLTWTLEVSFSTSDSGSDQSWQTNAVELMSLAAGDFLLAVSRREFWDTVPTGIAASLDLSADGMTIGSEVDAGQIPMDNTPSADVHGAYASVTAGSLDVLPRLSYSYVTGDPAGGFTFFVRIRDSVHPPLVAEETAEEECDCSPVVVPATALATTTADHARDILVDAATNNFALTTTGDLALVGGVPSIAQAIRQAVRTFLGEWFLDVERGLPWFESILVKNPNIPAIRSLVRDAILEVPGVADLAKLELDVDARARSMSLTFEATSDTGELIVDAVEVTAGVP